MSLLKKKIVQLIIPQLNQLKSAWENDVFDECSWFRHSAPRKCEGNEIPDQLAATTFDTAAPESDQLMVCRINLLYPTT